MRLTDKRFCFFEIIAVLLPLVLIIGAYSGGYPFSISGDIRSVPS